MMKPLFMLIIKNIVYIITNSCNNNKEDRWTLSVTA